MIVYKVRSACAGIPCFFLLLIFLCSTSCNQQDVKNTNVTPGNSSSADTSRINHLNRLAMELANDSTSANNNALQALELSKKAGYKEGEINSLFTLGKCAFQYNRVSQAIGFLTRGLGLSRQYGYTKDEMKCCYWISRCYRRIADYSNYLKYLFMLEELATKAHDEENLSLAYEGYGNLYRYMADYPRSIENYKKSIAISEKQGRWGDASTALNNMSLAYSYSGNSKESLKTQLENYAILKKTGNKPDLVLCLSNLSSNYADLGQNDSSAKYAESSLALIREIGESKVPPKNLAGAYGQYALTQLNRGNYDTALKYADKDLMIREKIQDVKNIADGYGTMASIYLSMGKTEKALSLLNKQIEISKTIGYINGKMTAYRALSDVMKKNGNYEAALANLATYNVLRDSFNNEKILTEVSGIDSRLKLKDQQGQIALLQKDKAMNELELRRRTFVQYALAICITLCLSLFMVLFLAYRQKLKANLRLEKTVLIRTRELRRRNQDLREFIYQSTHYLRSPISSIKGLINLARQDYADKNLVTTCLDKMQYVVDSQDSFLINLQKTSQLIEGKIVPAGFEIKQLLSDIVAPFQEHYSAAGIEISVRSDDGLVVTTDKALFTAIFENLVDNAIKFRKREGQEASYVLIEAREENKGVTIKVKDNGEGIEEAGKNKIFQLFGKANIAQEGFGLGLYIVQNAAEALGGSVKLEGSSPNGTVLSVWLPREVSVSSRG